MKSLRIFSFVIALFSLTFAQQQPPGCFGVPSNRKTDCGFPGITPPQCLSRGCCFIPSDDDVPWCFRNVGTSPLSGERPTIDVETRKPPIRKTNATVQYNGPCLFHCTSVKFNRRLACNQGGSGEDDCLRAGCCYDPRDPRTDRKCYYPQGTNQACPSERCQIPSGNMRMCAGFVTESVCLSFGCCSVFMESRQMCYFSENPPVELTLPPALQTAPTTPPTTTAITRRPTFLEILRRYNGGSLGSISVYDILTSKSVEDLIKRKVTDAEGIKAIPTATTTTTTTTTIATTTRFTTPLTTQPATTTRIACNFFRRCRVIVEVTKPPPKCEPKECGNVFFYPGSPVPTNQFKKIVGGSRAHPFSHPWTAMLIKKEGSRTFLCGAAVICAQWVVTSAHCMNRQTVQSPTPDLDAYHYTLYVGRYVGWKRKPGKQVQVFAGREGIDYMEQHEHFTPGVNRGVITNDIGIIRLKRPIIFNQYVQPACLPTGPVNIGRSVWATGWGITRDRGPDDSALKQVGKRILNNTRCVEEVPRFGEANTSGLICAGGERFHDTCTGDSGGPMVGSKVRIDPRTRRRLVEWELIGLTSLGSPSCNTLTFDRQPALYTDIYYYLPWIRARTHYCCRDQ